jgi:hypothetical protein
MPRHSKQIPTHDNRVVVIQDVEYFIEWPQLDVGHSFFLPTLELPKQVEKILAPFAEELGYRFEVRTRCEYGRYGVRVWRVY